MTGSFSALTSLILLLPEAKVGDYVLIHAGFAMQVIDEREVQIRDALVDEMNGAPRTVDLEIDKAVGVI